MEDRLEVGTRSCLMFGLWKVDEVFRWCCIVVAWNRKVREAAVGGVIEVNQANVDSL